MRLYHYMDTDAYEAMIRTGRLEGSPAHSPYPEFAFAYGWLADVMRRRIGPAPEGCNATWPVFSWVLHNGLSPLAYDREQNSPGSEDPNDAGFLVGFDVPDDKYLLSDFDDWHYVLNNWFLPSCGSAIDDPDCEGDRFEELCRRHGCESYGLFDEASSIPEVEAARRANWERIVDYPHDNGSVQATTWELRSEWVFLVKARRYHATRSWPSRHDVARRGQQWSPPLNPPLWLCKQSL